MQNIREKINFEKTYYFITLLFALTLPLSRAMISLSIVLLILLWVIEGKYKEKFTLLSRSAFTKTLFFFILYSVGAILFSSDLQQTYTSSLLILFFVVIFVLTTSIKKEHIQHIISAFLTGMLISEIISYGMFFELWSFQNGSAADPTPFMIHIGYSVFLAFTSLILLNRLFSQHYTLIQKIPIAIFYLTVTGNLFLSAGRAGQVALIAGIIVMVILYYKITIKSFLISLALLSTIFTSSWGIRAAYYITTLDVLKEHPFGVGLGDYKAATKEIVEEHKYKYFSTYVKNFLGEHHPHSQFLLVTLQMGFVGLGLFLYLLYTLFKLPIKDDELKKLSIIFAATFFTGAMAEPLLIKQFSLSLFVLLTGLFSAASVQDEI